MLAKIDGDEVALRMSRIEANRLLRYSIAARCEDEHNMRAADLDGLHAALTDALLPIVEN